MNQAETSVPTLAAPAGPTSGVERLDAEIPDALMCRPGDGSM
jgi:hypothetical protein